MYKSKNPQSNHLHKWDSIQYEFKNASIKSLTQLFPLCLIYVHILEKLQVVFFPNMIIFAINFLFSHFCDVG